MRAAVYHGPGDVRIESVPDPGPPGPGELLLAVTRNGICGSDTGEFRHGPRMIPLRERHRHNGHVGPMILGHEFVGRVAEAGPGAAGFAPGQRVACGAGVSCGACEWCRCGRTNLSARRRAWARPSGWSAAAAAWWSSASRPRRRRPTCSTWRSARSIW